MDSDGTMSMRALKWFMIGGVVGWAVASRSKPKRTLPEPLSLSSRFHSACITLTVANASHDIWWFYKSEDTRDLDAMNEFPAFFLYDTEAHFRSMIVGLHSLFDEHPGTLSLKSLIHELDSSVAVPIWKRYAILGPAAKKVRSLRHNVIAHRNAAKSYDDLFREIELSQNEIKFMITGALEVLTLIANVIGAPEPTTSPFVISDIAGLIDRIKPEYS